MKPLIFPFYLYPNPRYLIPALFTGALIKTVQLHPESRPVDDDLMALGAVRMFARMPRHIPDIDVMQSFRQSDFPSAIQGRYRSRRQGQVFGMETCEVYWHVKPEIAQLPGS